MAEFMDIDGVIRRSSTISQRMVLRGVTVGKLEFLRGPSSTDDEVDIDIAELDNVHLKEQPASSDWRRRRGQLVSEIRKVKHALLVSNNAKLQERTQMWYDATESDPQVETTAANTPQCPSPRAKAFVDAEGNLRRKSVDPQTTHGGPTSPTMRPSIVLEFMQTIISD